MMLNTKKHNSFELLDGQLELMKTLDDGKFFLQDSRYRE